MQAATVAQVRKAAEHVVIATALAHGPVYMHGVRGRIAASERADQARQELAAAVADFEVAQGVIQAALEAGSPGVWAKHTYPMGTADYERHLWTSEGLDINARTIPWNPL